MNNTKISTLLQDVLSKNEIKIYLELIKKPLSISEIARATKLDRSGCYQIIKRLQEKGLISEEVKAKGKAIKAEHPSKALQLLGNYQRKLRRKELGFEELLPEILAEYEDTTYQPVIKVYQGNSAYIQLCEDTLANKNVKEILNIGNLGELRKTIKREYDLNDYVPRRVKLGIRSRLLFFENEAAWEFRREDRRNLRETKFLTTKPGFNGYKFIYGNKISIISSYKELTGIIVESKEIAQMERYIYEQLWKQSK